MTMKRKHIYNDLTFFARALPEFRDFLDPLVRKEREELVESLAVLDLVDLLESVYVISSVTSSPAARQQLNVAAKIYIISVLRLMLAQVPQESFYFYNEHSLNMQYPQGDLSLKLGYQQQSF